MFVHTTAAHGAMYQPTGGDLRRALVVDDDADIRTMMADLLALSGFEATEARNGVEAITLARTLRPDLVTLDLSMPGLDGNGVLQALRATPATWDIPVVVISSDISGLVITPQVVAILEKPFDVTRFFNVIGSAVRDGLDHAATPARISFS